MRSIINFGLFIKQKRKDAGRKIVEVAKEAEISHSYLSQVENGKLEKMPSLDVIYRLAETLRIDFVSLMTLAGYKLTKGQKIFHIEDWNLGSLILDSRLHWNGNYPTLPERKMLNKFLEMILIDENIPVLHGLAIANERKRLQKEEKDEQTKKKTQNKPRFS